MRSRAPVLRSPSMKLPKLKTLLLAPLVLFALTRLGLATYLAMLGDELPAPAAWS